MPTAAFYKLSKRKNSTKQPTGSGTQFSVDLKSGTSFISPTLLLNNSGKPDYNYFTFEGWNYFITNIESVRQDLWLISGECDVLATAKAAILNTIAYVLYDHDSNTELPDNRLPIKTTKSVQASTASFPWSYLNDGCYILSITGSNGSTGIYKLTTGELNDLVDDVSDIKDNIFIPDGTAPDPNNYSQDVFGGFKYFIDSWKWLFNQIKAPFSHLLGSGSVTDNIRDAVYIPFNIGTTTPGPSPTYLGTVPLGSGGNPRVLNRLNNDTVVDDVNVSIPWQASDFRRRSPYTDVYIYLPYIGLTKLSSENLVGQTSINVKYAISLKNGALICTISSGSQILGQYSGSVACSAPIGISNINLPAAAQSIISGISSLAAHNIANVGMAALSFADSVMPNFTCLGGLDGVAGILTNQNITCFTVFHDTIAAPNQNLDIIGSPTMCSKALSSLTGFCQCLGAHVESDLPAPLLDEIDSFLNSGFYIE